MLLKTTIKELLTHDDAPEFPYFSAEVEFKEDPDAMPDKEFFRGAEVWVFIARDESLSVDEVKRRMKEEARRFVKELAAALP